MDREHSPYPGAAFVAGIARFDEQDIRSVVANATAKFQPYLAEVESDRRAAWQALRAANRSSSSLTDCYKALWGTLPYLKASDAYLGTLTTAQIWRFLVLSSNRLGFISQADVDAHTPLHFSRHNSHGGRRSWLPWRRRRSSSSGRYASGDDVADSVGDIIGDAVGSIFSRGSSGSGGGGSFWDDLFNL